MNGVPFCTICNEDVEVIIDIKNCPIYGNVVRKSKKEIRDEINKALQGKKKMWNFRGWIFKYLTPFYFKNIFFIIKKSVGLFIFYIVKKHRST